MEFIEEMLNVEKIESHIKYLIISRYNVLRVENEMLIVFLFMEIFYLGQYKFEYIMKNYVKNI